MVEVRNTDPKYFEVNINWKRLKIRLHVAISKNEAKFRGGGNTNGKKNSVPTVSGILR